MGNAVSPNLNDTEHQLLQDNTGKHLTASLPHKPCADTTVEQQYLIFSEFALLYYGISYHVAQGKIFLSFFGFFYLFFVFRSLLVFTLHTDLTKVKC